MLLIFNAIEAQRFSRMPMYGDLQSGTVITLYSSPRVSKLRAHINPANSVEPEPGGITSRYNLLSCFPCRSMKKDVFQNYLISERMTRDVYTSERRFISFVLSVEGNIIHSRALSRISRERRHICDSPVTYNFNYKHCVRRP